MVEILMELGYIFKILKTDVLIKGKIYILKGIMRGKLAGVNKDLWDVEITFFIFLKFD